MGTLDFLGISPPTNQLTTKACFWVQRAPANPYGVSWMSVQSRFFFSHTMAYTDWLHRFRLIVTVQCPCNSSTVTASLKSRTFIHSFIQKKKKSTVGLNISPHPQTTPFTYTFRFVHVGWGGRRNHPCQVSSQSAQKFRLPRGSNFSISHRLGEWLLQQCYALTCYTMI